MKKIIQLDEKKSLLVIAVLLLAMLVSGIGRSANVTDFNDYYTAAGSFTGMQDLYRVEEAKKSFEGLEFNDLLKPGSQELIKSFMGKFGTYIYPPLFAFLIQPLGLVEYETAAVIFSIINLLAFAGTLFLLKNKLAGVTWQSLLVAMIFSLLFLESHVSNNQVGLLLLLLVLAALYSASPWLTGLLLSLAISIKLTPAVFVLYLVVFKKYREILFTLLFLVMWTLLPFVYGIDYNTMLLDNWYNLVMDKFIKHPGFRAWKSNQSLVATLAKYFVPFSDPFMQNKYNLPFIPLSLNAIKVVNYGLTGALVLPLFVSIKNGISKNRLIAALFILAVVLSGISWVHSFIFLYFPLLYLVRVSESMSHKDRMLFYGSVIVSSVLLVAAGEPFLMFSGLLYLSFIYYYLVLKYEETPS